MLAFCRRVRLLILASILATAFSTARCPAQSTPAAEQSPPPAAADGEPVSPASGDSAGEPTSALAQKLQLVEAAPDLEATAKAKAVDAYRQAIAAAEAAVGFEKVISGFDAKISGIEQELKTVQVALAAVPESSSIDTSGLTLQELDSKVQQATATAETLRQEVEQSQRSADHTGSAADRDPQDNR